MVRLQPSCTPEVCLLNMDVPSRAAYATLCLVVWLVGIGKKKNKVELLTMLSCHFLASDYHCEQAGSIKQEVQFRAY